MQRRLRFGSLVRLPDPLCKFLAPDVAAAPEIRDCVAPTTQNGSEMSLMVNNVIARSAAVTIGARRVVLAVQRSRFPRQAKGVV